MSEQEDIQQLRHRIDSIDAKLVNRLGMRPDVKRIPIFGLGCVAGAAGLWREGRVLCCTGARLWGSLWEPPG